MPTCFVIQPFDGGKFDKRYEDTYAPALRDAGLEPYRVDQDPSVLVPIASIEQGIADADICFADITTDNPNVWYELGYAFALNRPVILTCSKERDTRYPFDIQHRRIIEYSPESPSDFTELHKQITAAAKALLEDRVRMEQVVVSEPVAPTDGLSQPELLLLAVLAGRTAAPDSAISTYELGRAVERSGLTDVGFGLAIRRLLRKALVTLESLTDEETGNDYRAAALTGTGWDFIDTHADRFVLKTDKPPKEEWGTDDVPF